MTMTMARIARSATGAVDPGTTGLRLLREVIATAATIVTGAGGVSTDMKRRGTGDTIGATEVGGWLHAPHSSLLLPMTFVDMYIRNVDSTRAFWLGGISTRWPVNFATL